MVKITLNPTTWKNPIYYVSALSVFVPLFFIASYGAGMREVEIAGRYTI